MQFDWNKAQYLSGEDVCIITDVKPQRLSLYRLQEKLSYPFEQKDGMLVLHKVPIGSYGIVIYADGHLWESAFDVVAAQRSVTRYGFLADFGEGDGADVRWMRSLHLNAVQFYDWMFRHDRLVPEEEAYSDPLGRPLNRSVVKERIAACRAAGMRPFAYGAVYAATKSTYLAHPQWGMYTMDGKAMVFADWLYFMNIAKDCPWRTHLYQQYRAAIDFGFSGIHMDTYGFPKHVCDHQGKPVALAAEFADLISGARASVCSGNPDGGVIFNAVNNWPVEAVAKAPQDAVYIEVWPPHDSYEDLYQLITKASSCSGKPVVLAAYLKAFLGDDMEGAERSMRLCFASIAASGGTQLVFGEDCGVLRDSYYVNYAKMRPEFLPCVQKYCDFLVRYAELLYNDRGTDITKTASGGINEDICFASSGTRFSTNGESDCVWTIIRESEKRTTVQLINLRGNNSLWNEAKASPVPVGDIHISIRLDRAIKGVYYASADSESLCAVRLPYSCEHTEQGRVYRFVLPGLMYWSAVWIEQEE